MDIERLRDFIFILHKLGLGEYLSAADLVKDLKILRYTGILGTLKQWYNSGYLEMKKLKGKELELGGPKIKFRISSKGVELKKELTKIILEAFEKEGENIEKESLIKDTLINEDKIQEFIIEFSEEIEDSCSEAELIEYQKTLKILLKRYF